MPTCTSARCTNPSWSAFRPPGLVTELIAADVPLVAALRQGELEPFGFPWRLIYLGDPLYRVGRGSRENGLLPANAKKGGSNGPEQQAADWNWWRGRTVRIERAENPALARIDAVEWTKAAAPHDLPGSCRSSRPTRRPSLPVEVRESGYDAEKLHFCVDAAIAEATSPYPNSKPAAAGHINHTTSPGRQDTDWRAVLRQRPTRPTGGAAAGSL